MEKIIVRVKEINKMLCEGLNNVSKWLSLLGLPGVGMITFYMFRTLAKTIGAIKILQSAQKAQMRSQLLTQYDTYMAQGYIEPIYLDDWINQYDAYHKLVGANAVLDARREDLIHLPNHKVS